MDPNDFEYSDDGELRFIDSEDLDGMHIVTDQDDEDYDNLNELYDAMSNVRYQGYFDDRDF